MTMTRQHTDEARAKGQETAAQATGEAEERAVRAG